MPPDTPESARRNDAVPKEQERVDLLDSKRDEKYEREGKNLLALSVPIAKGIEHLRTGASERKNKDANGAAALEATADRLEQKLLILLHDIDSATVEDILNRFSALESETGTNTDTASRKPSEAPEEKQKREDDQMKLELKNRYDDISLSIKIRMTGAKNNIAESEKTLKQQWFFQRWGGNEKSSMAQDRKYLVQLKLLQKNIDDRYAAASEKPELRSALLRSLQAKGDIANELQKTRPDFAKLRSEFDRTMQACDIAEQGVQYAQTALEIAASYAGPPGIAAALIPKYIVELTTGQTSSEQLAWKIVEDIATAYIGGGKFSKAILQRLGPVAKSVQKIFEVNAAQGWTAGAVKKMIIEFIDMFKDQQIQHAFADIKEAITGQEAHRVTLEEMAVGRAAGRAIGKGLDKTGVKTKIENVKRGKNTEPIDSEKPTEKKAKEKIAEDPLLQKHREENLSIAEPNERILAGKKAIKDVLGEEIDITKAQSEAIAAAHDVPMTGVNENGKPTYSKQDLATKMQILTDEKVGFSQKQADALLRMGVCGSIPPPPPPPGNRPKTTLPPPPPLPPRPGNAAANSLAPAPQKLPNGINAPPPPPLPNKKTASASPNRAVTIHVNEAVTSSTGERVTVKGFDGDTKKAIVEIDGKPAKMSIQEFDNLRRDGTISADVRKQINSAALVPKQPARTPPPPLLPKKPANQPILSSVAPVQPTAPRTPPPLPPPPRSAAIHPKQQPITSKKPIETPTSSAVNKKIEIRSVEELDRTLKQQKVPAPKRSFPQANPEAIRYETGTKVWLTSAVPGESHVGLCHIVKTGNTLQLSVPGNSGTENGKLILLTPVVRSKLAPVRDLQTEAVNSLDKKGGWKLHLNFDPGNPKVTEKVNRVLKELETRGIIPNFKIGHGGGAADGQPGKEATVYVGDGSKTKSVVSYLEHALSDVLLPPTQQVLQDDAILGPKIVGRFDVNGDYYFHQYGSKGISFTNKDSVRVNNQKIMKPEVARENADRILRERYGRFYSGGFAE